MTSPPQRHLAWPAVWLALGLLLCPLLTPSLPAQIQVLFTQTSDPSGIVSNTSTLVATGTVVTTAAAPPTSAPYQFVYWTLNDVRQPDALGQGLNQVTFVINEPTAAVAHYLPVTTDADNDGIPDWFEVFFYGSTATGTNTDTDADGFTLQDEYNRDYNPNVPDIIVDGGLAGRSSALLAFTTSGYVIYHEISSPPGFLDNQFIVATNTPCVLPDVSNASTAAGYQFGQWLTNGVRVADALGRSMGGLTVLITTDTTATAVFYPANQSTAGDGLPDWFKWQYCGTTNIAATTDSDDDSFTLLDEYNRDYHPSVADTIVDGGLSGRSSALIGFFNPGYVVYHEISSPPGFLDNQFIVATNTPCVLPDVSNAGTAAGYQFGQWLTNGVRVADALGRSMGGLTVLITTDTTATAVFYPANQSTAGDGLPDWFKWQYCGTTNIAATTDSDGDSFTLLDEYNRDYHPNIPDTVLDGGLSGRSSTLFTLDLREYCFYKIISNPTGLVNQTGFVPVPTVITTSNYLSTNLSGYVFGHWDLNGVRQQDLNGSSLPQLTFTIFTTTVATANFYAQATDSNANGLPDWWEDRWFGSPTNALATADPEGDGLTNLEEYQGGSNPLIADRVVRSIDWLGGIDNWSTASKWSTGIVPNDAPPTNCVVYIDHGNGASSIVTQDVSATLERLKIDAGDTLHLLPGVALTLHRRPTGGIITNTGVIELTASELRIVNGAGTLTGGGTITLTDDANNLIRTTDTNAWFYNLGNTIIGSGNIGSNTLGIVNAGTIIANQSTPLILDPADTLGFTNTGTIQVNTGSTLTFQGPGFLQTAGTLLVNGTLAASNGLTLAGGLLTGTGTNLANISNNGTLSPGAGLGRLAVVGNLTQQSNACLTIEIGGYDAGNSYDFVSITGTATFAGRLVVSMTNNFEQIVTNGASFTVLTAAAISGAFSNAADGGTVITPNGRVQFTVQYSGTNLVLTAQTADTDGDGLPDWWETLYFGDPTNALATADADADGLTNLEEYLGGSNPLVADRVVRSIDWLGGLGNWSTAAKWSTGIVPNDAPPTNCVVYIDHGNGASSIVTQDISVALERLKIDAGDILHLLPGVALTLHRRPTGGSITNAGVIELTGSELRIVNGAGTLTGGGTITLTDDANNLIRTTDTNAWFYNLNNTIIGSGDIGSNTLGLVNAGTIIANQSTPLVLDPADTLGFTNTGTIQVNTGSTLTFQGPGFLQTAGTLLVNGTLAASNGLTLAGGLLTGTGTNLANISNNGTLSPGAGLGRLAVIGNLTQQSNACLTIELGGYEAGNSYDFVSITGTATFAGRLVVSVTNSFDQIVTNGASFTVLTAAAISGAFSNVANGGMVITPNGWIAFTAQYSGSNLVLTALTADSDSDGLPDWWETLYFGDPTNALATADPDGDGLTNLDEYLGGTNPLIPDWTIVAVDWLGGLGNWSTGAQWSTGIVPNDAPPTNYVVYIDHGNGTSSIVTQDVSITLKQLKLDAGDTLRLLPGVALTLQGRPTGGIITNAGVIELAGAEAGVSELRIVSSVGTLTGSGTITMTDHTNNFIRATDTNMWFYNLGNTISGSGNLGSNSLGIVNAGTIIANQSTPLILDPADTLGFTNTGTIQINTGSTLAFQGPGFCQTAGTLLVNGTLAASNGLTLAGGLLTGTGTNLADISNNGTLSPASSLTVVGNLTQQSNACLTIEIGGYDAGSSYDFVSITGTATLGGRLMVSVTNNFDQVLTNGASFTVLTAGAISGAFSNVANGVSLTTPNGTAQFLVQYSDTNLLLTALTVDADNDGMPNWWEDLYGLNKLDPSDALQDADGDGFTNLQEYRAGTIPTDPNSRPAITSFRFTLNGWELGFTSVSGKFYAVEFATDLRLSNAWQSLPGMTNVIGDGTFIQIVDPTATNTVQRFYRLRLNP